MWVEAVQPPWSDHIKYSLLRPPKYTTWGLQVPLTERTVWKDSVCPWSRPTLWAEVVEPGPWVQGEVTHRLLCLELTNVITPRVHTLFPSSTHASHPGDSHLRQHEGTSRVGYCKGPKNKCVPWRCVGQQVDGVCGVEGVFYSSEST